MILVTGGTGLLGRHLVRTLVQQGYRVRCLVRSLARAREILPDVELLKGDVTDLVSLRAACRGVEGIFHTVAVIRESEGATFEKVNVEGTFNMVVAAGEAGVRRFVHISALGASNNPRCSYVYSKWLGEEAVRQSGLEWTIVRPSVIYGEGFGFFDRLWQSVKLSPPPFVFIPGRGNTLFQPIDVDDVVKCLLYIWNHRNTVRQIYEIGGPEHLSYVQMLHILLEVCEQRRIVIPVPLALLRGIVSLMTKVFNDPPVTLVELKQLEIDNITEPDAVYKNFGFKPRSLREGLRVHCSGKKLNFRNNK